MGCEDHGFLRNPEPWEFTDGCIHLLKEISIPFPRIVISYIPRVIEVATLPAFPHYQCLLETIWKQFSLIFTNLVSTTDHEDSSYSDVQEALIKFLPAIIKAAHASLTCKSRLAMNAAGYFFDTLIKVYGLQMLKEQAELALWADIQQSPYVEMINGH